MPLFYLPLILYSASLKMMIDSWKPFVSAPPAAHH
jgi:hypothetical protein